MSIDKIRKYLKDAEVNDDTFDKFTRSVERLIPLTEKVTNAEKTVIKEVESLQEMRGNKQSTLLDGGFDGLFKEIYKINKSSTNLQIFTNIRIRIIVWIRNFVVNFSSCIC